MDIIKWIIKPLIRLHKWINRWVWPIVLLICSSAVVISNLIKLRPLPVLIGVIGIALAIMNLRSAIKNHKAGKGSENTSGSLPPATAQENDEW